MFLYGNQRSCYQKLVIYVNVDVNVYINKAAITCDLLITAVQMFTLT